MRGMGEGPISVFAALSVNSFEDAEEMITVVRRFLGGCNASKHIRKISVLDIPCLVFEWDGLLRKVGSSRALLSKMPADKSAQVSLHKQLASGYWHPKYHTSTDPVATKKQGWSWCQTAVDLGEQHSALHALKAERRDHRTDRSRSPRR